MSQFEDCLCVPHRCDYPRCPASDAGELKIERLPLGLYCAPEVTGDEPTGAAPEGYWDDEFNRQWHYEVKGG